MKITTHISQMSRGSHILFFLRVKDPTAYVRRDRHLNSVLSDSRTRVKASVIISSWELGGALGSLKIKVTYMLVCICGAGIIITLPFILRSIWYRQLHPYLSSFLNHTLPEI